MCAVTHMPHLETSPVLDQSWTRACYPVRREDWEDPARLLQTTPSFACAFWLLEPLKLLIKLFIVSIVSELCEFVLTVLSGQFISLPQFLSPQPIVNFYLFSMAAYSSAVSVMSYSLLPCGLYPMRLLCSWDSTGKNTGVGPHDLLQGIFLTQGSNLRPLHC